MRYEFDRVGPVAMNCGTLRHGLICNNVSLFLRARLRERRCRVYGPTQKVEVLGRIRYPDVMVSCTDAPTIEIVTDGNVDMPEIGVSMPLAAA